MEKFRSDFEAERLAMEHFRHPAEAEMGKTASVFCAHWRARLRAPSSSVKSDKTHSGQHRPHPCSRSQPLLGPVAAQHLISASDHWMCPDDSFQPCQSTKHTINDYLHYRNIPTYLLTWVMWSRPPKSINQSKHICVALYVANESETKIKSATNNIYKVQLLLKQWKVMPACSNHKRLSVETWSNVD